MEIDNGITILSESQNGFKFNLAFLNGDAVSYNGGKSSKRTNWTREWGGAN